MCIRLVIFAFCVARAERVTCVDKRADCVDVLMKSPAVCQEQRDFALMMCPRTCGVCPSSGKLTYFCLACHHHHQSSSVRRIITTPFPGLVASSHTEVRPDPSSGTVVRQWDKTCGCYGSRDTVDTVKLAQPGVTITLQYCEGYPDGCDNYTVIL